MASNIDTLRKILTTGIGAALMTEESLSKLLSDIKLPRDAKNYLVKQAQKRKSDLANIVAQELKGFLSRINIHEELHKALHGLRVDVEATIHVNRHGPSIRVTKSRVVKSTSKRKTKRVTKRTK